MKKTELRAELKKLDKTGLTKMFIAAYDELTPTKKEKIDALILDQCIEEEDTKEPKKKEFKIDMKTLKDDIDNFVSNAEDGLYYSPNRKVSKAKRSKWRFEAKDYFKKLMEIPQDSEFYADGVKYLLKMFGIMCHANGVYTFRTEDPFRAVFNETEEEFFPKLLDYVTSDGLSEETIREVMMIIGKNSPDRESLSSDLLAILAETVHQFGKDEEAIRIALEEHEKNLPYVSQEGFIITAEMIETKQIADNLPLFILFLRYQLGQYDEGYEFFMETEMGYHSSKEVRLYVLLDSLGKGLPETWVHLYERAVADGIEPRKSLQEKYASLKASE